MVKKNPSCRDSILPTILDALLCLCLQINYGDKALVTEHLLAEFL
jgi:hypothetical protein